MYILTSTGKEMLLKEEDERVFKLIFDEHSKDFHYLAFDRQLNGFSPLGCFCSKSRRIAENSDEIIRSLVKNKEVCSLNPEENLTLYPLTKVEESKYKLDLENIDRHFAEILYLNDNVYKTKYMIADFGNRAENMDEEMIMQYLRKLLQESTILEKIYIESH